MTGKGDKRRQGEDTEAVNDNWVAAFPKINPSRDKKYRAWVRTHPCLACSVSDETIADHHIHKLGTGIKCSDYETVPVCYDHHQEVEKSREDFERRYGLDLKEEAERRKEEWDGNF